MKQDKLITICENHEFQRAYRRGKSYVSSAVVVYVGKNRTGLVRYGITTSKKVGNAVERTRARRVLREAFRPLWPGVRPGLDLVLVARGRTPHCKSTEVGLQIKKQLLAAGVWKDPLGKNEKP